MVEVVNIVAGGDLDVELDLFEVFSEVESAEEIKEISYEPVSSSSLQLRFEEDGPVCMIYRTGKFVITGAGESTELDDTFNTLIEFFETENIIQNPNINIEVYNKVFTGDLEVDIDLSKFSFYIGFEDCEYEPEQTPFMTYRPSDIEGVVTIASTGKLVINGVRSENEAQKIMDKVKSSVKEFASMT